MNFQQLVEKYHLTQQQRALVSAVINDLTARIAEHFVKELSTVIRPCTVCGQPLVARKRQRQGKTAFCSTVCQQREMNRRKAERKSRSATWVP